MKKLANIFLVISSGLIFTGILFKNMHWPGASVSLLLGSNLSLLGMLFYFIARYRDKSNVKVATYSVYFYFFVMVVGTGYYSAIAASKDLLNGFHDVNVQLEKSNVGLISMMQEGHNSNGFKVYKNIELHKRMLISGGSVLGLGSKESMTLEFCDARGIPLMKDNLDISSSYFLFSDGGANGDKLEESLKDLRAKYVISLGEDHPVLFSRIESRVEWDGREITWKQELCKHLPMIAVLSKLSLIQNQVLNCELAMQK